MDQVETYRSTLQYALVLAGSELALSVRLRVPLGTLRNWLEGIEPIPDRAFLDAVDVVVSSTPADIERARLAMTRSSPDPESRSPADPS